jgi:thiamine-monophosphate kinase
MARVLNCPNDQGCTENWSTTMTEREIIETIAASFARSPQQRNGLFASDAEILEVGGRWLALTVDDYSAEDRLTGADPACADGNDAAHAPGDDSARPEGDDPALLGWNLVTATLSDLLAVGAVPRFLLNSLVVTPAMDRAYLSALATGMQAALTSSGAAMAGGDIGTGPTWRFTGVALGDFRDGQPPLSRLLPPGARAGAIMATGAFGDANLAAATRGPAPRFEMRLAESAALASLPSLERGAAPVACIDTSDGLGLALETLCTLNVGLHIEVDPAAVPYAPGVIDAVAAMRLPREVFLLGSAGEYELLALVPDQAPGAIATAERAGLRAIGAFTIAAHPGVHVRRGAEFVALPALPDPREAASFDAYCSDLISLAQRAFGAHGRP